MAQDASKDGLGVISRRALFGAAAGVCWPWRESLVLEAIAAQRMPHRVVVRGVKRAAFFELRDYGEMAPGMVRIWNRYGIRPVLADRGRFLIPFETLAGRERAWRELSLDAQWIGMEKRVDLREVTLFRAGPKPA